MRIRCKLLTAVCGALLAALTAAGQFSATLSGPMLGYVWNGGEGRLRPLQGMPGSAIIGEPVDLGLAIAQAFALDGRHFLASTDASTALLFVNMESAPASIAAIEGAPAGFSQAARSRSGSAAALYYMAEQRVLVVTGLPSQPKVTRGIDVSVFGDTLARMAVSDDGNLLIYAATGPQGHSLYGWTPTSGYRVLTTAAGVSDITLAGNGDAIVADASANEVFSIVDPRGSAVRRPLLDQTDGISNPTGVIVSPTNQIYIANADSETIMILDSTGRLIGTQECGCELSGFYPLQDSVYRLSGRTDGTIFLLETGPAANRVVFVPGLQTNK
jgi:hypothetical protein